jgi:hypothetical protein
MKAKSLADQFADAQEALAEATLNHDRVRAEYFADRRRRAKLGEDLEPLDCLDGTVWQAQLAREEVARSNGEQDRLAGLMPAA